ncbi:ParB/RepB/Spo0J family partition protein [Paenibacillus sp. FSL R7-0297]|uniref:ParB/RepB/Spo0J family partition protein n=1 Tax=Paenibacillus sp. FSL R7-0297 TaxID=2921680 RepID=UPI0030F7D0C6
MLVKSLPIDLIDEDLGQPRYNFEDESLIELASSIQEIGLLNPIKVNALENGRYRIIFGNRRYKAFCQLNLKDIPCIISEDMDELSIYLEQLAENIQRESFSPVEEAEAFYKLLNEKYKISTKYLSTKLGKTETYIRTKLELLKFSKDVRSLIKSGKETVPDRLTEDQLIPLKDVAYEFRDALAMKVASSQIPPKDVKRIATMFKDTEITNETKKNLIKNNGDELLRSWSVYDEEKRLPKKPIEKPKIVDSQIRQEVLKPFEITPIEQKVQELISHIPSYRPLSSETIFSHERITLDNKVDFQRQLDLLIENLEKHLSEFRKVRDISKKSSIKVIK